MSPPSGLLVVEFSNRWPKATGRGFAGPPGLKIATSKLARRACICLPSFIPGFAVSPAVKDQTSLRFDFRDHNEPLSDKGTLHPSLRQTAGNCTSNSRHFLMSDSNFPKLVHCRYNRSMNGNSKINIRLITIALIATSFSANLSGQVVQLPTFRQFSVNTTVSVPDGGSAFLGGVTTARSGSTSNSVPLLGRIPVANRLFQNRAIGSDVTSSRAYVRAQVIDLLEMDAAILQQARNARLARQGIQPGLANGNRDLAGNNQQVAKAEDPVEARARFLSQNMGRSSRNPRRAEWSPPESRTPNFASSTKRVETFKRKSPAAAASPEPPLILGQRAEKR